MSMTKKECLAFERMVESILSSALGAGKPYLETALQWTMPHANGCYVVITLFRDSFDSGRGYRNSWLAAKLHKPDSWRDAQGYSLPQSELPWPSGGFTYPSGKNNFHMSDMSDETAVRNSLVLHLYKMAAKGSPEKVAFGAIEFEPA